MPQVSQIAAANAGDSLLQARSQQVLQQTQNPLAGKVQIEKAAKAFESLLLDKWLEQAEHSFASVPGMDPNKDNADPGADQFRSLAFQSLAEKITNAGGIGIAKMIVRQLESRAENLAEAGNDIDSKPVTSMGTKEGSQPSNATKVFRGVNR